MLHCYVNYNPQDRDSFASTLTHSYSSHFHCFLKTLLFGFMLNLRFSSCRLHSTVPSRNILIAVEQRTGLRATLQHTLARARTSSQRTQECYKLDFEQRHLEGREKIRTGHYIFTDNSFGDAKRPKLQHAVEKLYRVLQQDKDSAFIQRKKLSKGFQLTRLHTPLGQLAGQQYCQSQRPQGAFRAEIWKISLAIPWNLGSISQRWRWTSISSTLRSHL